MSAFASLPTAPDFSFQTQAPPFQFQQQTQQTQQVQPFGQASEQGFGQPFEKPFGQPFGPHSTFGGQAQPVQPFDAQPGPSFGGQAQQGQGEAYQFRLPRPLGAYMAPTPAPQPQSQGYVGFANGLQPTPAFGGFAPQASQSTGLELGTSAAAHGFNFGAGGAGGAGGGAMGTVSAGGLTFGGGSVGSGGGVGGGTGAGAVRAPDDSDPLALLTWYLESATTYDRNRAINTPAARFEIHKFDLVPLQSRNGASKLPVVSLSIIECSPSTDVRLLLVRHVAREMARLQRWDMLLVHRLNSELQPALDSFYQNTLPAELHKLQPGVRRVSYDPKTKALHLVFFRPL
jgi:hypothetical protein